MPIDSSTAFDTVVLFCRCSEGEFGPHWVQQGTAGPLNSRNTSYVRIPEGLNPTDPEVAEVISRVRAGTAHVYYNDVAVRDDSLVRADQAGSEYWQFHSRHPFWATDGYKLFDRLVTKTDLVESNTEGRSIEFEGGFVPQRQAAGSAMVGLSLADWVASREGNQVVFALAIPESEEIELADLATYAPTLAMRNWLNERRGYRLDTQVPPNRVRQDELPASLATVWPSGASTEINYTPDLDAVIDLELARNSLGLTAAPGTTHVIRVRIVFNVITTNTGAVTPDTDALNRLLQASTSSVPGSGMMIEPPHGNSEVKTAARRLAVGQSELVLDNGLITVVWTDPGGDVARVMPLSSDYGRTMDLAELPDRSRGNGKRLPFPDEYPRANAFHYHGSANIDLDFEDMFRLVGYPGADRFGAIHNRGTGKIFLNDWRPSFFLELLPGEVFSFRATVDREGDRELVGVEVPRRRLIWDASAYSGITRPYYNWSFGGYDFRLRPFFGSTVTPRYRDVDVFSFGTGTLVSGTTFNLAGWVATPEVWVVSTGGDIEISAQITLEITGSGALADGHSALLVRRRDANLQTFARTWHPPLTGVGTSRPYTLTFRDFAQPNDRYAVMLLYPQSSTVDLAAGLRVVGAQVSVTLVPHVQVAD